GDIVGLAGIHPTGNLNPAATNFGADHGCGHDLSLALLEQDDRHALADVFPSRLLKDARARAVQADVHCRLAGLIVETRLRIVDPLAGEDDLLAHEQRYAAAFAALVEELAIERNLAAHGS